ncbi:VOC family protein [Methylomonas koyamae]|uniref:VOC family protein n=1 Tax=Methylomonas koyamae TaxID=702114 RepID=UPI00287337AF|nr:VOC family protein [Methylomonas koyamae]WNB76612.1 VOC family protein [Methylomonas koyamae]
MNLTVTEIKAFVPAKDFDLSLRFYQDLGFTLASSGGGVAYFHHGKAAFLLQDFYHPDLAERLMMHLLVEDLDAWWQQIETVNPAEKYGVRVEPPALQPWGMRDFILTAPCGVLWRIEQNLYEIPGESLFLPKDFFGHPAGKNRQKLRDRLCLRRPDSSASPRSDPARGRNVGSRMT